MRFDRWSRLARVGAGAGGRPARRVVRGQLRRGSRGRIGTTGPPHGCRREDRPLGLRGDGDRHGEFGCGIGERARWGRIRCAKSRAAVDRADRGWLGRLLHDHRSTVPGLPGLDRTCRSVGRRRPRVDARPDRAARRVPRHGARLGGRQDDGRDRRTGRRVPYSRVPHRRSPDHHLDRPLRRTGCVRRVGARRRRTAGAVPQFGHPHSPTRARTRNRRRQRARRLARGRGRSHGIGTAGTPPGRRPHRGLHRVLGRAHGHPGAGPRWAQT